MSGNKDILIDKRKVMCARKRKQRIDQYLPFNRLMFSHLLESMASTCLMVNWEDKHGNSECLLPPSLTQLLLVSMTHISAMICNISRWRQLSWLCPLPDHPLLVHSNLLVGQAVRKTEKFFTLCKHCLAAARLWW